METVPFTSISHLGSRYYASHFVDGEMEAQEGREAAQSHSVGGRWAAAYQAGLPALQGPSVPGVASSVSLQEVYQHWGQTEHVIRYK